MKILALESSATACSVALCEDEKLIAHSYQNNGLTHSVTLMPMTVNLLSGCGISLDEVELIAGAGASAWPPPRGWPGPTASAAPLAPPWSPWPGTWPTLAARSAP